MSEISITRFQPAPVTRGKVNSVESVENDLDANPKRRNPQEDVHKDSQHKGSGNKQQQRQESQPAQRFTSATPGAKSMLSEPPLEDGELEQAVSRLNEYVQTVKRDLIFDIDPENQEPSVTVVDRESRKVLRQFDSKEALELAKKLESQEPISLFKTQV
ncbi:flagellar protein FlaG [Pseudohongiella spirulinae]|uniref:Flagellin protein FlaG n=1 Tax=Pseudohongiella spirulinae TaxID=1249552 RepID=A0A0S2KEP4_9GAMM|nr:flagellar protein FlaG [Pseudohongiella spirulinae]ALO46645.1 Flagellin protein FlaG [Pseudohongiella spirulinae]